MYDGHLKRVRQTFGGATTYSVYSLRSGAISVIDNAASGEAMALLSLGPVSVRWRGDGSAEYVHLDHLGSSVAASNAAGAVTWRESYLPFGEGRLSPAANDNRPGFTGHVDDAATGLTYMQARYFDPVLGRFLQTDPVGYADQLNLYAYVGNDPVNRTDPTGQYKCEPSPCSVAITQAAGDLATAAAHADSQSAQGRLENAVGALGNEGDEGVTIVTGGNAPGSSMSASGGSTINVAEGYMYNAETYSAEQRVAFAAKLGHETTHLTDARDRDGGNPTNIHEARATERNAYRTQIDAVQGMANAGLYAAPGTIDGIPGPGSSEATNDSAANALAEQSVRLWCANGGNCQ